MTARLDDLPLTVVNSFALNWPVTPGVSIHWLLKDEVCDWLEQLEICCWVETPQFYELVFERIDQALLFKLRWY